MKKRQSILVLLTIVLILSGCASSSDVVATVNDEKIDGELLDKQLVLAEMSYRANGYEFPGSGEERKKIEEELGDKIIESYVTVDLAKKNGIEPQEEEAKAQRDNLVNAMTSLCGSSEEYEAFLAERGQDRVSFDEYLLSIARDNEVKQQLYEKVTENVSVSDDELVTYYNGHQAYYNYSTRSVMDIEVQDKKNAEQIRQEIVRDDMNFEEAMKTFKDRDGVVKTSDLGPLYYGSIEEAYAKIVFSMEQGEVSSVFESNGNYHIASVYQKNVQDPIPYDEIQNIVEGDLLKEKKQQAYNAYFDEQLGNYQIGIN